MIIATKLGNKKQYYSITLFETRDTRNTSNKYKLSSNTCADLDTLPAHYKNPPMPVIGTADLLYSKASYISRILQPGDQSYPIKESFEGFDATALIIPHYIKSTFDLMKQLVPELETVIVVTDHRFISSRIRQEVENTASSYFSMQKIRSFWRIPL